MLLETLDPENSMGNRAGFSGDAACKAVLEVAGHLVHFIEMAESSQEVAMTLEEKIEEAEKLLEEAQTEAAAARVALQEETERADELSARIKKSAFKVGADKEALKKARRERDEASRSVKTKLANAEQARQADIAALRSRMKKDKTDAEGHRAWLHDELVKVQRANRDLRVQLEWAKQERDRVMARAAECTEAHKVNEELRAQLDWTRWERDQAMARAEAAQLVPDAKAEVLKLLNALERANSKNLELFRENISLKGRLRASEARSAEEARDSALAQVREELRETREELRFAWGSAYRQGFEECRSAASALCPERSRDFLLIPMDVTPLSFAGPSAATQERTGDTP